MPYWLELWKRAIWRIQVHQIPTAQLCAIYVNAHLPEGEQKVGVDDFLSFPLTPPAAVKAGEQALDEFHNWQMLMKAKAAEINQNNGIR